MILDNLYIYLKHYTYQKEVRNIYEAMADHSKNR